MIGVVVAAHGNLSEALVEAARLVVPSAEKVHAVSIAQNDDSKTIEANLRAAIAAVGCDAVLILTDMFGGSPSNIGLTLHEVGKVEVLTGANLPMVIRALQLGRRGYELGVAAREVKEYGARAIAVASEVLAAPSHEEKKS